MQAALLARLRARLLVRLLARLLDHLQAVMLAVLLHVFLAACRIAGCRVDQGAALASSFRALEVRVGFPLPVQPMTTRRFFPVSARAKSSTVE